MLILTSGTYFLHCFAGFEVFCILTYLAPLQDQADIRRVMVLFGVKALQNIDYYWHFLVLTLIVTFICYVLWGLFVKF